MDWNFLKKDWNYALIGQKVALKEIKDSRYDIAEFLKVQIATNSEYIASHYGISKNPSTQNYIFVMNLFSDDLHGFLNRNYLDLDWELKIDSLLSMASGLENLHARNLVH
ncbi:8721_t:CDS:2, partial [Diversispora eburnea]